MKWWKDNLSDVDEIKRGSKVGNKVREALDRRYQLIERGAASVSTFLKGKIGQEVLRSCGLWKGRGS